MHAHKLSLGIFLIVTHFGILLSVLGFWIAKGFLFSEAVTALGLIGPLFAGYTTVILSYISDHRKSVPPPEEILLAYRLTSLFMAMLFGGVIEGAVILWAYKIAFTDFEQFKILVGLLEGAFGVYVGQFVYSMFKKAELDQ